MRILIIEDEEKIATLVKLGLEKEGYAVDWLADGESGQRRIEVHNTDYNLIILDLMLPKRDGFEVCKNVREQGITTPILILTAKSYLDDKVYALDRGADDYLIKPFEFKELLARIRAILRRPKETLPAQIKVGELVLDPSKKQVFKAGKEIKLTLKEFVLLEYLMRHPNQAVNREQIQSNVWDFDFNSFSNVIDVHMNSLRKKIDGKSKNKMIETVRGIGYKIKVA